MEDTTVEKRFIIVRENWKVPEIKKPPKNTDDGVIEMLRELIELHDDDTHFTVCEIVYGQDLWVSDGREVLSNHDLIVNTSMNLFDDLQGEQEVFAGRNFRILRSLNKQLAEWQDDQTEDALIETFHTRIQAMCEKQTAATLELENCQSLLPS